MCGCCAVDLCQLVCDPLCSRLMCSRLVCSRLCVVSWYVVGSLCCLVLMFAVGCVQLVVCVNSCVQSVFVLSVGGLSTGV